MLDGKGHIPLRYPGRRPACRVRAAGWSKASCEPVCDPPIGNQVCDLDSVMESGLQRLW